MLLGNDIVDLREPGNADKPRDRRFLERVFSAAEQRCIAASEIPALSLWMLWSGKESAFKIVRKLHPEIVFAHQHYRYGDEALALVSRARAQEKLSTSLLHEQLQVSLQWRWNRDYVHCIAGWCPGVTCTEERLCHSTTHRVAALGEGYENSVLSAREEESVHSPESREARLLAKALLREAHQLRRPEIVRKKEASRFLPPVVWEKGKPAEGIELSLSHDGRYVAVLTST